MNESPECGVVLVQKRGSKKPSRLKKEVCQLRAAHAAVAIASLSDNESGSEWSELDQQIHELLKKVNYFQTRLRTINPVKASSKRRLVYGLKEIRQLLQLQKPQLKLVIIANDVEHLDGWGRHVVVGCSRIKYSPSIDADCELYSRMEGVDSLCQLKAIPLAHASTRKKLSKLLKKSGRVSAVGIMDCSGAEDIYQRIIELMKSEENTTQSSIVGLQSNIVLPLEPSSLPHSGTEVVATVILAPLPVYGTQDAGQSANDHHDQQYEWVNPHGGQTEQR